MKVQQFQAESMADALQQIRATLGPDAIIISSRRRSLGGLMRRSRDVIEVVAGLPEESDGDAPATAAGPAIAATGRPEAPPAAAKAAPATQRESADGAARLDISAAAHRAAAEAAMRAATAASAPGEPAPTAETPGQTPKAALSKARARLLGGAEASEETPKMPNTVAPAAKAAPAAKPPLLSFAKAGAPAVAPQAARTPVAPHDPTALVDLRAEIAALRDAVIALTQSPPANQATGAGVALKPSLADAMAAFREAGFEDALLADVGYFLAPLLDPRASIDTARASIREAIIERFPAASTPDWNTEQGTRAIFVTGGPGSGKTLAAVKLALRLATAEGRQVVLAGADQGRPGAIQQLEAFAEALDLQTAAIYEPADLEALLEAGAVEIVVVDTGAVVDAESAAALAALTAASPRRTTLLAVDATARPEAVTAFLETAAVAIDGLIATKTDIVRTLGSAFASLGAAQAPLLFLSDGRDATAGLQAAGPAALIDAALAAVAEIAVTPEPIAASAVSKPDTDTTQTENSAPARLAARKPSARKRGAEVLDAAS